MYEPIDQIGFYGRDPFNPLETFPTYIITGDSGQGMTGSTIGAMIVTDLIMGKTNAWADVYRPDRLETLPQSVSELGQEVATTARGFGEVLLPRGPADVIGSLLPSAVESDLKPGEGKVSGCD